MSSITYLAELAPDPQSRRIVLGSGFVLLAGGIAAAMLLPLGLAGKLSVVVVWCLAGGRELLHIASGNKACCQLRLDASGDLTICSADGQSRVATLAPGSVVTSRVAWIRFTTADGRRHAELLRSKTAENHDWRRLQVIWRHLGAAA